MLSFDEIHKKLIEYPRFRKEAGFSTVKILLDEMGYEDSIPFIHVVGTNGKGSVSSMVNAMIQKSDLKVGLFTSPHLVDIRERMMVDGYMMSEASFVNLYKDVEQYIKDSSERLGRKIIPTFFEYMFLLGILYFKKSNVDVMILEAGIGGQNDTTNVLMNKWMTIITSISLDHTSIIGDTIEMITREKGGVIKSNSTTVLLDTNPEVTRIIEAICHEKESNLVKVTTFSGEIHKRSHTGIDFSMDTKYYYYERLHINAVADYQLVNCKLAVSAYHELSDNLQVKTDYVVNGLRGFSWPGRMNYVAENILVDGSHNYEGIQAFVSHVNDYEDYQHINVMFTCMEDKQSEDMVSELLKIKGLKHIYVPSLNMARQLDIEDIKIICQNHGFNDVVTVNDLKDFFADYNSKVGASTLLCCVGSLYLVGEIMKI